MPPRISRECLGGHSDLGAQRHLKEARTTKNFIRTEGPAAK